MSILRYRSDDLPTGIWNASVLSLPIWILIALLFLLSGCAQWQQMTPRERKVVIGAGIAAAVVAGAVAAHNADDDPAPVPPAPRKRYPGDRVFCAGPFCK